MPRPKSTREYKHKARTEVPARDEASKQVYKKGTPTRSFAAGNFGNMDSAAKLQIAQRRVKVFELAKQGYTVKQIADKLGFEFRAIWDDIQYEIEGLRAVITDGAKFAREMELNRLDEITKSLFPLCVTQQVPHPTKEGETLDVPPSLPHVDRMLRVMERRSKLLGLDAPDVKMDMQVPWDKLTAEQLARVASGADIREILYELDRPTINITPEPKALPASK